ncbi:annexin A7-like [Ptychodera flava]|uniref:annexin A7-like n=1 Tax=Ptychodera flava TaxID=63121 RepID=UPI00396A5030
MAEAQGGGTVKAKSDFDGQKEAEALRKAMKGLGTNEKAIIEVLTNLSNAQRVQTAIDYKTMFGRDLIKDFKSELSGKLEAIVLALMMPSPLFDAHALKRAMKGAGTDEDALIEILCSRNNAEITAIKLIYKKEFKNELEEDIRSDTSGNLQKLFVSLSTGGRDENAEVDSDKAKADAKALFEAGEKAMGTDESRFNMILATRSYPQLRATFDEYAKVAKKEIEASIKSEMSGNLEKGMLSIVKVVRDKPAYFAEQLHAAMKGLGTDDKTLVRILVSRCEKDLVQIKREYFKMFKVPIAKSIAGDTSGDYRAMLLAICGGPE